MVAAALVPLVTHRPGRARQQRWPSAYRRARGEPRRAGIPKRS